MTAQDDLGVAFLKIFILDRLGETTQTETLLRKLVSLYPNEAAFRGQLIRFYVAQNRQDEAINEQRAVVAAKPDNVDAGLDLADLLNAIRGPAAARDELIARTKGGGPIFPYQIALAQFEVAQGNVAEGTQLLKQLIKDLTAPDDALRARTTLAQIYLSRNDVASAESLLSDILESDDRNINALRMRASIRMDRGQIQDAIADLRPR